jgi:hypothetical protein
MIRCVDAALVTRRGLFFTAIPLGLLEQCREDRDEMVNRGAKYITFCVDIDNVEEGTHQQFEARDILVRML